MGRLTISEKLALRREHTPNTALICGEGTLSLDAPRGGDAPLQRRPMAGLPLQAFVRLIGGI